MYSIYLRIMTKQLGSFIPQTKCKLHFTSFSNNRDAANSVCSKEAITNDVPSAINKIAF